MAKFMNGTKFYRYLEGQSIPEIIRLRKTDENGTMHFTGGGYTLVLDRDEYNKIWKNELYCSTPTKINTPLNGCKYRRKVEPHNAFITLSNEASKMLVEVESYSLAMSTEDLVEKYIKLVPDGMITASKVHINGQNDVVITLHRDDEQLPYAVCRQNIVDIFSPPQPDLTVLGVSVSVDTCPSNANIVQFLAADETLVFKAMAVYKDDSLTRILRYLGNKKPFDTALKQYLMDIEAVDSFIIGTCSNLKWLLSANNFMDDFRSCFHVIDTNLEIRVDQEALNIIQADNLSGLIGDTIADSAIVQYDRTVNMNDIDKKHVIINANIVYDAGDDDAQPEKARSTFIVAYTTV